MPHVLNKSTTPETEKDRWRTPPWLYRHCVHLLGGIDFDTACDATNALAPRIVLSANNLEGAITDWDALHPDIEWHGRLFCNPPYSKPDNWVEQARRFARAVVCFVIPSPSGVERYDWLINYCYEQHVIGRVNFIDSDGNESGSNPLGTSIFVTNPGLVGLRPGVRRGVRRDALKHQYGGFK